jgi:hypothetical protein
MPTHRRGSASIGFVRRSSLSSTRFCHRPFLRQAPVRSRSIRAQCGLHDRRSLLRSSAHTRTRAAVIRGPRGGCWKLRGVDSLELSRRRLQRGPFDRRTRRGLVHKTSSSERRSLFRPESVTVPRANVVSAISARICCVQGRALRAVARMLRWMSRASLWSRWTHSPSPEDDEQEAQRILAAKVSDGSEQTQKVASTHATGIKVTTRRTQLNTFRDVRLMVDGGSPVVRRWGTSFIPVTPGRHVVRCYYPMNFVSRGGDSSITIEVPDGHVVAIEYKAPFFGINPGTWTVILTPG